MPEILNVLLRSLTLEQLDMLRPIERAVMPEGDVIYCQDEPISHLIFTDTGLFSTLRIVRKEANRPVEIWCYGGRKAVIGAHTLLQRRSESLYEYVSRIDGTGWRVRREALHYVMARDTGFAERIQNLNRVTHAGIGQVAACRAVHNFEQRLCRQLQMIRTALEDDLIPLQIQLLADMVPMSRQHVYRIAAKLTDVFRIVAAGIEIIDGGALARHACSCFQQADGERALILDNC